MTGLLSLQPLAHATDKTEPAARPAGQRLAQFRERMQDAMKELNLTDEQQEKLKAIRQEQGKKLREIWQDQSLSRPEKMAKLKTLREEMEPKLKQILTGEQFEKWQKQREKMRDQVRERLQARQK